MSMKTASPTAQLLRGSRLFSIPHVPSVPRIQVPYAQSTLPYPTQQAVVTTHMALKHGDWGFKRALPAKVAARTSLPIVRLNAVDTWEKITDYSSTSDLALNLERLEDLGMAITTPSQRAHKQVGSVINVFDDRIDHTDPSIETDKTNVTRWKYTGPWVSGMTPGQFDEFVRKTLTERKKEFMHHIRKHARREILRRKSVEARDQGLDVTEAVRNYEPSDSEIEDYIRRIRNQFNLNSDLSKLVEEFLDLPRAMTAPSSLSEFDGVGRSDISDTKQHWEEGPSTTHPSAGISYLRTNAYLNNDPLFGPRAERRPIEARMLKSKRSQRDMFQLPSVGFAGAVAKGPSPRGNIYSAEREEVIESDASASPTQRLASTRGLGLGLRGGNRIWASASKMQVDARGRLKLGLVHPSPLEVAIAKGEVDEAVLEAASVARSQSGAPRLRQVPRANDGGTGGYIDQNDRSSSRGFPRSSSSLSPMFLPSTDR